MPIDPASPAPLGNAELSHRRPTRLDRFWFGVVYYPEHWDAATRAKDPQRMKEAGVTIVRMAEFAWDLMEREEGRLDFSLFDQAIAALGQQGISTILCTPTATPPRWLTLKHPEIHRVDANGVAMAHGSRQHACHSSQLFRQYSRAITADMAKHFQGNPHVVGWQTDNEINCHFSECHCSSCQTAFQSFLRRKYDEIGELNRRWGTAFWAQTYDRFEDIPTPRRDKPTYCNPAHELDYYRFISDSIARFQHDQVEILRAHQPNWWVTHNGCFGHIDYRGLFTKDLDALGYDVYPMFCADHAARAAQQAWGNDCVRAFSGNFIVPEHQGGAGGQRPYFLDAPDPGEMRRMTWATIARGADSLLYFRWRTCRFGAEEYWLGIIDHDDVPRRRYDELKRVGAEVAVVGPELIGTSVHIDCAVASGDFDAHEAHGTYPLGLPASNEIGSQVHRELFESGHAVGCVHPADDLEGVKLYVVPHWAVFDPAWVGGLERWVSGGGVLVVGARTATRDLDNNVVAQTLPGCLRPLLGVTVEEYGRQNRPDQRPLSFAVGDAVVRSELWYEALACDKGTGAFCSWRERHLAGTCAVSHRQIGKGHALYVGTYLTTATWRALQPEIARLAGLQRLWADAPREVEVARRDAPGRRIWFFMNRGEGEAQLPSVPKGTDLLTGKPTGGALTLPRHGVAIIKDR
jgi:beta-galactosidase